jgi:hypothetical protein
VIFRVLDVWKMIENVSSMFAEVIFGPFLGHSDNESFVQSVILSPRELEE